MAFDPNVYDSVTVTESVEVAPEVVISVYDEVTVTDAGIEFAYRLATDSRDGKNPKMPFWKVELSMASLGEVDELVPGWEIEAYAGSALDKRIPGRVIEASGDGDVGLSMSRNIPAYEVTGYFGSMLDEKIPVWGVELEITGLDYLELDKTMPGWTLEATITFTFFLYLDGKIPLWRSEGLLEASTHEMELDEKMPFWKIEAEANPWVVMELDEKIPVWEIDAEMYDGSMELDAETPAWVMDPLGTGDDYGGGSDTGLMTDSGRFTDYVLRYVRP